MFLFTHDHAYLVNHAMKTMERSDNEENKLLLKWHILLALILDGSSEHVAHEVISLKNHLYQLLYI